MRNPPEFRCAPAAALVVRVVSCVLLGSSAVRAQVTSAPPQPAAPVAKSQGDPRPSVAAALRRDPVDIDGRLTEGAWSAAIPITELHQQTPDAGRAPSQRTELRILYDANAIYVGARMFDSAGPGGVRKLLVRRDQLLDDNASDKIALVLDPYRDRQTRVCGSS